MKDFVTSFHGDDFRRRDSKKLYMYFITKTDKRGFTNFIMLKFSCDLKTVDRIYKAESTS